MNDDKYKVFNGVYMKKKISINQELYTTTITIYNKDRIKNKTLGSIKILTKDIKNYINL